MTNNARWALSESWTGRPGFGGKPEDAGPLRLYWRWAYHLDGNHHGPWLKDARGVYQPGATLRSCWSLVVLGRDGWVSSEGRRSFGLRLYRYHADGSNHSWDIGVLFRRSPCPRGSRYGPLDWSDRGDRIIIDDPHPGT